MGRIREILGLLVLKLQCYCSLAFCPQSVPFLIAIALPLLGIKLGIMLLLKTL